MKMRDFVQIIKDSGILGKNKVNIVYKLLQAAGADAPIGMSSQGVRSKNFSYSPSESTIKKWLSEESVPRGSSYFPEGRIVDGDKACAILDNPLQTDQWIKLRDLFKTWHIEWLNKRDKNEADNFCINIGTDDFYVFSASFWIQFASYFGVTKLWNGAPMADIEIGSNTRKLNCIANEMVDVFIKKYTEYKVYEFIPKDIGDIINSLGIYYRVWDENGRPVIYEDGAIAGDAVRKLKKMYCRWVDKNEGFTIYPVIYDKGIGKIEMSGKYIFLNFGEDFDYDTMLTDIWLTGYLKYAVADSDIYESNQFKNEILSWKECQSEIIIVEVTVPIEESASSEEYCIVMDDCHMFINDMLELADKIDLFMQAIDEKIIRRYEGGPFDIDGKLLYNDIVLYIEALKNFKEYLSKFNSLEKEKGEYFSKMSMLKMFGMYCRIYDYCVENLEKPHSFFSDLYLNVDEANEVEAKLRYFHESLRESYARILSYKES